MKTVGKLKGEAVYQEQDGTLLFKQSNLYGTYRELTSGEREQFMGQRVTFNIQEG